MNEQNESDIQSRRRNVRRRAFANLVLGVVACAKRTGGRLRVQPTGPQAIMLEYGGVRTLVRDGNLYRFAVRDFAVVLVCPENWPFERAAAPQPFIMAPNDAAHPNSDGRSFCIDLQGVMPAQVAEVIYDNLRIRRFRLDHCVDANAASFVRAHLDQSPADPRPLYEENGQHGTSLAGAQGDRLPSAKAAFGPLSGYGACPLHPLPRSDRSSVPVVDVAVGAFDVSMDDLAGPAFLRLARSSGGTVDAARSLYLSVIDARLTAAKAGWIDGPGLLVDTVPGNPTLLRRELLEAGHACAALGEEAVARSYVSFFEQCPEAPSSETRVRVEIAPNTQTKGGSK